MSTDGMLWLDSYWLFSSLIWWLLRSVLSLSFCRLLSPASVSSICLQHLSPASLCTMFWAADCPCITKIVFVVSRYALISTGWYLLAHQVLTLVPSQLMMFSSLPGHINWAWCNPSTGVMEARDQSSKSFLSTSKILNCICSLCVGVCAHGCGSQKTICRSQFSPSSPGGLELWSSGLAEGA